MSIRLWKDNRVDGEYSLSDEEVAEGFATWLRQPETDVRPSFEFALRWYLARQLNSAFEPEDADALGNRIYDWAEVRSAFGQFLDRVWPHPAPAPPSVS
jgi:hypothetical protein